MLIVTQQESLIDMATLLNKKKNMFSNVYALKQLINSNNAIIIRYFS